MRLQAKAKRGGKGIKNGVAVLTLTAESQSEAMQLLEICKKFVPGIQDTKIEEVD